jgi:uncharacterized protein YndB with AHSA1/START domain
MTTQSDADILKISRTFNAPLHAVWNAWANQDVFKQWWGPKTYTCPVSTLDFQTGGKYLNCMRSPDGKDYWGTGTYKRIIPMEQIVFTDSFSDSNGAIVPASYYGMTQDYPLEMQITVTFNETDGKTTIDLVHQGLPVSVVMDTKKSWNESFDKLSGILTAH